MNIYLSTGIDHDFELTGDQLRAIEELLDVTFDIYEATCFALVLGHNPQSGGIEVTITPDDESKLYLEKTYRIDVDGTWAHFFEGPTGRNLSDRDRLKEAFKALRRIGYVARMSACSFAEPTKHVCCGHERQKGGFHEDGSIDGVLYLDHELLGDDVVPVLRRYGLNASWDEKYYHAIQVRPWL